MQAYLKIMADLRRVPRKAQPELISRAVRATGLEDMLARPISQLSKGYRQRVGLTQSIFHQPKVLILDEPTIGLDPTQIIEVRGLIGELAKHSTVFLSTHILSEVEAICDRAFVLLNGRVRADARMADLSASAVTVLVLGKDAGDVTRALAGLDGAADVTSEVTADGRQLPHHRAAGDGPSGGRLQAGPVQRMAGQGAAARDEDPRNRLQRTGLDFGQRR